MPKQKIGCTCLAWFCVISTIRRIRELAKIILPWLQQQFETRKSGLDSSTEVVEHLMWKGRKSSRETERCLSFSINPVSLEMTTRPFDQPEQIALSGFGSLSGWRLLNLSRWSVPVSHLQKINKKKIKMEFLFLNEISSI